MSALATKLARATEKVRLLEDLIEDKTRELYHRRLECEATHETLNRLFDAVPGAVLLLDEVMRVIRFNRGATQLLGRPAAQLDGAFAPDFYEHVDEHVRLPREANKPTLVEAEWKVGPNLKPVLVSISDFLDDDGAWRFVVIATDLTDRRQMELELHHAHKLEAIGALAAGVAHEVNTPVQFVSDNTELVVEGFTLFETLVKKFQALAPDAYAAALASPELEEVPFFREQLPRSLGRIRQGLTRVTEIVRAMKDFSHPGGPMGPCKPAVIAKRALTVGQSELKGVAVSIELDPALEVPGYESDLNQVFLNLLVNSGQAITDNRTGGKVRVWSTTEADELVLHFEDDAGG
ncbi:MAG: histidine kinase dimerization/phospho-acceptor domain-containing protein, partial [Myxococcaceae bacterium]